MNFQESLDYLFGLGYERSVKKFGLENTYTLLNALGNPQNNFIKVQVAGTNGKGSTCAFLESICVQAGIEVGVNTSPHLVSVTERIRINGTAIPEEDFGRYTTKVRGVSENLVEIGELEAMPTFFEHITAIAQLVFADEGVKVTILEAGLGGRFDATTATEAEIVAITPIDLDHTKTLGDTIEKIAAEKAAIIRKGAEAVIAGQKTAAMNVILQKCAEDNVRPVFAERVRTESVSDRLILGQEDTGEQPPRPTDTPPLKGGERKNTTVKECADRTPQKFESWGPRVSFETEIGVYENVRLGLSGKHQIENAKVAILLAESLQKKGFSINPSNIKNGLENAVHEGRLEFSNGILFDGAHNLAGAKALREYLDDSVNSPITMVFGSMRGKNLERVAKILFPLAEKLILTTPENPRAMEAAEIADFAPEISRDKLRVIDDPGKAIEKARELVGDGLILVTGSLYLIGEVQAYLQGKKVERKKKKT